jgi:hypothetical protein
LGNVTINQFMFPREDDRGPRDEAWLDGALERAQAHLASVQFDRPGDESAPGSA